MRSLNTISRTVEQSRIWVRNSMSMRLLSAEYSLRHLKNCKIIRSFRGMNNSVALRELANNPEYKDICKKVSKGSPLYEDLFQEVFIIIADYDKEKIKEIHSKGQLKYFFTRIVMNNFNSSSSPFYYKHRANGYKVGVADLTHVPDPIEDYDHKIDKQLAFIQTALTTEGEDTRSDWYKKTILRKYQELGSYDKVSKATGIPLTAVYETIKEFKKEIKAKWSES